MEVKVSVIIPVYNSEKYLRQCLDSVLSQNLREIEVICVDDGSTDESTGILLGYASKDERLKVVCQKNSGPGTARNNGLRYANGKYVIFLDSDDWFEPDMLEKLFETAERTGADITICKTEQFDAATGEEISGDWMLKDALAPSECFVPADIADHIFQLTYGMVWDKLYLRSFIEREGLGFPSLRAAEDTAFVYKSLLFSSRIALLPEVKVHYRINRTSSVSNSFVRQPEVPFEAFRIIYEFVHQPGLWEHYERSFLNWAMEYLVWQVCNMPDREIRRQYYDLLHKEWFPKLRMDKQPASFYENKSAYAKYLLARYAPYQAFSHSLDIFKAAKKRRRES